MLVGICSKYILWLTELQNRYCIYGIQLNFVRLLVDIFEEQEVSKTSVSK